MTGPHLTWQRCARSMGGSPSSRCTRDEEPIRRRDGMQGVPEPEAVPVGSPVSWAPHLASHRLPCCAHRWRPQNSSADRLLTPVGWTSRWCAGARTTGRPTRAGDRPGSVLNQSAESARSSRFSGDRSSSAYSAQRHIPSSGAGFVDHRTQPTMPRQFCFGEPLPSSGASEASPPMTRSSKWRTSSCEVCRCHSSNVAPRL